MGAKRPSETTILAPEWTPRQREVLDLLVRGYTNGQVAQALGISLDGAKWHVTEILTKLGVRSREDAAEYWRREQGIASRLSGWARFGGTSPAWLKAGSAVAAAVIVAGVALAVAWPRTDGTAPSGPEPTPATVATATPAPTVPASGPPTTLGSVPVERLSWGPDAQLPPDLALYYFTAKYAGDGPFIAVGRAYRTSSGELVKDDLLRSLPESGSAFSLAFDPLHERIAVAVCRRGYCGGYGQPTEDSQAALMISMNGGLTWTDEGELPRYTVVLAWGDQDLLLSTATDNTLTSGRTWVLGDPGGSAGIGNAYPRWFEGLGLLWIGDDSVVRDELGNVAASVIAYDSVLLHPSAEQSFVRQLGLRFGYWLSDNEQGRAEYVADTSASGALTRVFSYPADIRANVRLSEDLILGGALALGTETAWFPIVLINLKERSIRPIPELGTTGGQFIRGARQGPFVRVSSDGDCLNNREAAAAAANVIECAPDDALLTARPFPRQTAGGVTWVAVTTLSGTPGWASAEFLSD
jgi:DNA-binding CsgD family transcriptional regulator